MQRALVAMSLAWAAACGPQVEVPTGDGGSSEGSTSEGQPLDTGATSTGGTSTTGTSTTDPSATSNDSTADSSGDTGVGELVPPESVLTSVTCNQGDMLLLVEVLLEGEIQDCLPPPSLENELLIGIPDWSGLPGTFVVGPDGPALASLATGLEELTGTITLEVWAPTHPSVMTVDLVGASGLTFEGVLDLGLCMKQNEAPCEEPPPDGG
jgi:hypothetical protein